MRTAEGRRRDTFQSHRTRAGSGASRYILTTSCQVDCDLASMVLTDTDFVVNASIQQLEGKRVSTSQTVLLSSASGIHRASRPPSVLLLFFTIQAAAVLIVCGCFYYRRILGYTGPPLVLSQDFFVRSRKTPRSDWVAPHLGRTAPPPPLVSPRIAHRRRDLREIRKHDYIQCVTE